MAFYILTRGSSEAVAAQPDDLVVLVEYRASRPGVAAADDHVESGFYDQSHFVKSFRAIYKMTPADYRRRHCAMGEKGRR